MYVAMSSNPQCGGVLVEVTWGVAALAGELIIGPVHWK